MLGGSWLLIDRWGLPGVGVACLATSTLVAAALLISGRTGLLSGDLARTGLLARLIRLGAVRRRWLAPHRTLRRRLPPALAACGLPAEPPAPCSPPTATP